MSQASRPILPPASKIYGNPGSSPGDIVLILPRLPGACYIGKHEPLVQRVLALGRRVDALLRFDFQPSLDQIHAVGWLHVHRLVVNALDVTRWQVQSLHVETIVVNLLYRSQNLFVWSDDGHILFDFAFTAHRRPPNSQCYLQRSIQPTAV
jgi:hypothetical protein